MERPERCRRCLGSEERFRKQLVRRRDGLLQESDNHSVKSALGIEILQGAGSILGSVLDQLLIGD